MDDFDAITHVVPTGEPEASVCVLCGEPWEPPIKNRCECGGFCTWGKHKGADPDSWTRGTNGWSPKPPPKDDAPTRSQRLRDAGFTPRPRVLGAGGLPLGDE